MGSLADEEAFSTRVFTGGLFPSAQFLVEHPRVDDHAIAEHQVAFFAGDTGGQQVELQHLFTEHDGVSSVVSTLESGDPRGLFRQSVNQFSLAFVAPLSTQNHGGWHLNPQVAWHRGTPLNPVMLFDSNSWQEHAKPTHEHERPFITRNVNFHTRHTTESQAKTVY